MERARFETMVGSRASAAARSVIETEAECAVVDRPFGPIEQDREVAGLHLVPAVPGAQDRIVFRAPGPSLTRPVGLRMGPGQAEFDRFPANRTDQPADPVSELDQVVTVPIGDSQKVAFLLDPGPAPAAAVTGGADEGLKAARRPELVAFRSQHGPDRRILMTRFGQREGAGLFGRTPGFRPVAAFQADQIGPRDHTGSRSTEPRRNRRDRGAGREQRPQHRVLRLAIEWRSITGEAEDTGPGTNRR